MTRLKYKLIVSYTLKAVKTFKAYFGGFETIMSPDPSSCGYRVIVTGVSWITGMDLLRVYFIII